MGMSGSTEFHGFGHKDSRDVITKKVGCACDVMLRSVTSYCTSPSPYDYRDSVSITMLIMIIHNPHPKVDLQIVNDY